VKRINFAKQYEAQRLANEGLSRWVLPWSEPGARYRALYNEVRLGLVVELKRVTRIPARYRRDADRELLALVLRLLNGPPEPGDGKPRPHAKRAPPTPAPRAARRPGPLLRLVTLPSESPTAAPGRTAKHKHSKPRARRP
jgi:hypothetical protein